MSKSAHWLFLLRLEQSCHVSTTQAMPNIQGSPSYPKNLIHFILWHGAESDWSGAWHCWMFTFLRSGQVAQADLYSKDWQKNIAAFRTPSVLFTELIDLVKKLVHPFLPFSDAQPTSGNQHSFEPKRHRRRDHDEKGENTRKMRKNTDCNALIHCRDLIESMFGTSCLTFPER